MSLGRGEKAKEERVFRWLWREVRFESAHWALDGPSLGSGGGDQYKLCRRKRTRTCETSVPILTPPPLAQQKSGVIRSQVHKAKDFLPTLARQQREITSHDLDGPPQCHRCLHEASLQPVWLLML